MRKLTFDEVLITLEKLEPWLGSLGLKSSSGRWKEAVSTVRRAKEANGGRIKVAQIKNYVPGLHEAMEMYTIFEAFGGDGSPALKD